MTEFVPNLIDITFSLALQQKKKKKKEEAISQL